MRSRPRWQGALGVSLLVHAGLLLAPIGWWGMLGLLGGGDLPGAGIPGPWRGDEAFLVSEVAPGVAAAPPARPESGPRTPPEEPSPEEEPPSLPDAVAMPAEEPVEEAAPPREAPPREAGSETAGADSAAGAPAGGITGGVPGAAAGAGPGGGDGVPSTYVSPKPLVVALLELEEPRVIEARLLISPEGRVIRVEPEDPDLAPELRAEVERVAANMRFVPGRRDGRPVEAWCTVGFASRGN